MKSAFRTLLIGFALLMIPALTHAQVTGCDDSPEDPTVALALVGSAGVLIASARMHLKARKSSGSKSNHN
jgi:XrtJ-associated TM-motif-TM protein